MAWWTNVAETGSYEPKRTYGRRAGRTERAGEVRRASAGPELRDDLKPLIAGTDRLFVDQISSWGKGSAGRKRNSLRSDVSG